MRNRQGRRFAVWKRRQSWFWLVLNQHGNGGTIGTAATEDEAMSEACSSIEQMAAQDRSSAASLCLRNGANLVGSATWEYRLSGLVWMDWWMSVAQRVSGRLLTR